VSRLGPPLSSLKGGPTRALLRLRPADVTARLAVLHGAGLDVPLMVHKDPGVLTRPPGALHPERFGSGIASQMKHSIGLVFHHLNN